MLTYRVNKLWKPVTPTVQHLQLAKSEPIFVASIPGKTVQGTTIGLCVQSIPRTASFEACQLVNQQVCTASFALCVLLTDD